MNAGCNWRVKLWDVNEEACHSSRVGWLCHSLELKIGHMLTFKVLTEDSFKVIVFDLFGVEVVIKCGQHDPSLAMRIVTPVR